MGEPSDYKPTKGHSFSQATVNYQQHAKKRIEEAVKKDEPASNLIPVSITTDCLWPLIILADVTGSVGAEWLKFLFAKFPYIFENREYYMGKDLRICFGALGDSHPPKPDKYFFQGVEFVGESGAAEAIKKLIPNCNGGGQAKEDYQFWALYALTNIHFPKARRKPLIIFTGDEAPWDSITRQEAKRINVNLDVDEISTDEIFRQLKKKCTVYIARKVYRDYEERDIHRRWVKLLGDSHVCVLQKPDRIVDVIFGIMAKEAGRIPDFMSEIQKRQTAEQCKEVMEILEPIFADETPDEDLPVENESDEGIETPPLV